jgi:hypothetical protein
MGIQHQRRGTVGQKSTLTERDSCTLRRIVWKKNCSTDEMQQNWIFILKTVFPPKPSDVSFTNPTSTVGLQLLNLWLLERWCHDQKTWTSDNWKRMIWSDESFFTLCPTLGRVYVWRTSGSLQSGMPGCNSETQGRFCDGVGSNIVVQYSVGPIINLHGRITARDRLGNQVHPMIQTLFLKNDAVFQVYKIQ